MTEHPQEPRAAGHRNLTASVLVALGAIATTQAASAAPPATTSVSVDPQAFLHQMGSVGAGVHDPSTIVRCNDEFWVFYTGAGTPSYRSKDLVNWTHGPHAFPQPPGWVHQAVPANRGNDFWAPDVMKVGDKYLLFISASSFGKNTSAIGVASVIPSMRPARRRQCHPFAPVSCLRASVSPSRQSHPFRAEVPASSLPV